MQAPASCTHLNPQPSCRKTRQAGKAKASKKQIRPSIHSPSCRSPCRSRHTPCHSFRSSCHRTCRRTCHPVGNQMKCMNLFLYSSRAAHSRNQKMLSTLQLNTMWGCLTAPSLLHHISAPILFPAHAHLLNDGVDKEEDGLGSHIKAEEHLCARVRTVTHNRAKLINVACTYTPDLSIHTISAHSCSSPPLMQTSTLRHKINTASQNSSSSSVQMLACIPS